MRSSIVAAVAALATSVAAQGSAMIQNNCPYDVYLWAVDAVRKPATPSVIKAGGSYSEAYHQLASGGVSLKLSKTTDCTYPLQFEYTYQPSMIWYDGSHVNCAGSQCPFYSDGVYLAASDPSCPTRTCAPNQVCTGFYTNWNDDINTLSCKPSANVNMYLCSQSASTTPSTTGGSAAAAAGSAAPLAVAAASQPQGAVSSTPAKVQMEAVAPGARVRRHLHNHMRRHSHQ